MRFPSFLIFILLIPAFIALGNDIYLFQANHLTGNTPLSIDLIKEKFKFSAFGFIWTTYSPETYKAAATSLDPKTWATLDSLLTIKAFFAGLSFAGIIVVFIAFFGFFGLGPMAGEGGRIYGKKEKDVPTLRKKAKKMVYNRK
ncbi:MAG: hypothetical protein GW778_08625 [Alphaproteobacteria bacterium]|nr:hypothetical protein [Alphaproteobacteria bacterium]